MVRALRVGHISMSETGIGRVLTRRGGESEGIVKASWRAQGMATVVGTVVGTGGWMLNLGHYLWPAHPGWALTFLTIAASIVTMFLAAKEERQGTNRRS